MIQMIIHGEPPRTTAQQRKITVVNGKPRTYAPKRLRDTEDLYYFEALKHAPKEPMAGAVELIVGFHHGTDDKRKHGTMKTTRPDTDNMVKALKDALTRAGWWKDDAQVAIEHVSKLWTAKSEACVIVRAGLIEEEYNDRCDERGDRADHGAQQDEQTILAGGTAGRCGHHPRLQSGDTCGQDRHTEQTVVFDGGRR